ncbi:tigger transposable element-derived protein 2 [Plakobranchus ocellatus]|uniref:Tigger transposable element-derived protein 2 n=1 Tax=Plakobranchus ocellatus TaxID=259542 RepID=A0AAV4DX62_9GAST|nr:tigger transposable element-derived protein 2 [Plakobranchus ocellatus]
MDTANFTEWFITIVVPWARKREGMKALISDNLSSHISPHVIEKCEQLNIAFILLPPNSIDKLQVQTLDRDESPSTSNGGQPVHGPTTSSTSTSVASNSNDQPTPGSSSQSRTSPQHESNSSDSVSN